MIETTFRTFKACALVAAAIAFSGCRPAGQQPQPTTIKVASYVWPGSYWIDVALNKGWFTEVGIKVERTNAHGNYFETLDEVASGKLDAMGFSQFDLVRQVANGHDLVGIVATDYSDGAEALVAKAGIHSLRELKGKRLALPRGTYLEYLLSVFAQREGVELADLTLVDRAQTYALEDFIAGRVDAVFVWEPQVTRALEAGGVSLFSSRESPGLTYSILAMQRDFIKLHPQQVAALLSVWRRAEQYVRNHPDESCEIVAQAFQVPLASVHNLLRNVRVLNLADNGRAFSYAAGFDSMHASWRRMNDFMLERGIVANRIDSPTHLDAEFLRRLD
jgi:NitT/TauT family transport system substrate-binding protein